MFLFEWSKPCKNIDCVFKTCFLTQNQAHYTCCIENKNIDENYELKFIGHHTDKKTNDDVIQFQFSNCNLKKIPNNLKEFFPNFKILHIVNSKMKKINSSDLSNYQHLQGFDSINNELEYLPGDLFKNFKNIEQIIFRENKFEFIEPNILNELENLKLVEFWDGQDYVIRKNISNSDDNLIKVKKILYEKLFTKFESLEILRKSIDALNHKNQELENILEVVGLEIIHLKISNNAADQELQKHEEIVAKLNQEVKKLQLNEAKTKKENQKLTKLKTDADYKIEHLKSSTSALHNQISQLESTNKNLKIQNGQFKSSNENFRRQMQSYKSINEVLSTKIEEVKKSEEELQQEVEEIGFEKSKVEQKLQKSKELFEKLTKNLEQLKMSEEKLKIETSNLKTFKISSDQQIQQLKRQQTSNNIQIQQLKVNNKNLKSDKKQLQEFKAEILTESTKDFKIIIADQEFPIHKFLLAARSPTLAEILKNNPDVENLNLVDISVEIFEQILKFLYTDELPADDGTNFLHLFAAAGKLKITKLVKHAAVKIVGQVNSENALTILPLSVNFELKELKLKAFKLLKQKYGDIKFEDEWLDNPEKLIKVVAMLKKKEEIMKKFDEEFKEVTAVKEAC